MERNITRQEKKKNYEAREHKRNKILKNRETERKITRKEGGGTMEILAN